MIHRLFTDLGWRIIYFRPFSSSLALWQSLFFPPAQTDLLWVPCFRHDDINSAAFWARKNQIPLIIDPFLSAYAKKVLERKKWSMGSFRARRLQRWEASLLARADVVVADTRCHADFYEQELAVSCEKTAVLPVGAEEELFSPQPWPRQLESVEILFYGSFLRLHGIEMIIKAAALSQDLAASWVILGDGNARQSLVKQAVGLNNVTFESWIPYNDLPQRIARAHIVLGIFGDTPQAARVIPNKCFQAMAVGRPIITRTSEAYDDTIGSSSTIGWVRAGDEHGLAAMIRDWLQNPAELEQRGRRTRQLYEQFFAEEKSKLLLVGILAKAMQGI